MHAKKIEPILTITVPTYNHSKYVTEALNSIQSKYNEDIQIVICDDASIDDTANQAQNWIKTNEHRYHSVLFTKNSRNQGVTKTLNTMISMSTGKFITGLASDDKFSPRGLDATIEGILLNQTIDFFFTDCQIMNEFGLIIKSTSLSSLLKMMSKSKLLIMILSIFDWQIVWARPTSKREKLLSFGKYREDDLIEDRWISLNILNQGNYRYLDYPCYIYRYRGKGMHPSPSIPIEVARKTFHKIERDLHPETQGLLKLLLYIRRLPFKTNLGKWPTRGLKF